MVYTQETLEETRPTTEDVTDNGNANRKLSQRKKIVIVCLIFVLSVLLVIAIVFTGIYLFKNYFPSSESHIWPPSFLDEPSNDERDRIISYIESKLKMVVMTKAKLNENYIFSIVLKRPTKKRNLIILQNLRNKKIKNSAVKRDVLVRVAMGGLPKPEIREYTVTDIGNSHKMKHSLSRTIDWNKRPLFHPEENALYEFTTRKIIGESLNPILKQLYEAEVCKDFYPKMCLFYMFTPSAITPFHKTTTNSRITWLRLNRLIRPLEHYPIDVQFAIQHDSTDIAAWKINSVWFQNKNYATIKEIVDQYKADKYSLLHYKFEKLYNLTTVKQNVKSTTKEKKLFEHSRIKVEEDSRRVKWGDWEFISVILTDSGPRLYDLRFNGKSIAYQFGLDETTTSYSGITPWTTGLTTIESAYSIGGMSANLLPGIDCPKGAIYLSADVELNGENRHIDRAICIFEWLGGNGSPLRRHAYGFTKSTFQYGQGLPDRILILRTISTLWNYDYLFEFELHQSGDFYMHANPTGLMQVDFTPRVVDNQFKFMYSPNRSILTNGKNGSYYGALHYHMFNLIIDLDLGSTGKNFLMSLNMKAASPDYPSRGSFTIEKELINIEKGFSYDFSQPKMYFICEGAAVNSPDELLSSKCFKINNNGLINTELLKNQQNCFQWSKYILSVSKQKDDEISESSIYNTGNLLNPEVNADSIINGEDISNTDIVMWATIGGIHLPKKEDILNTVTPGNKKSLHLSPFNYFEFSPDSYSSDDYFTYSYEEWNTKGT